MTILHDALKEVLTEALTEAISEIKTEIPEIVKSVVAELNINTPPPAPAKVTKKKATKKAPAKKAEAKTTPAPEVVEAEVVEPDDLGLGDDAPEEMTMDQVIAKAREVAETSGRAVLKSALDKLGAAKIPDLKPEQYTEFVKLIS